MRNSKWNIEFRQQKILILSSLKVWEIAIHLSGPIFPIEISMSDMIIFEIHVVIKKERI